MKEINLETVEAVTHTHTHTHTHYTFSEINSKALLKIGEFLSSYKNKKAEVL